ncbi:hypothetical protein [Amycolatopsis sp. WQ 127309]|uniref:hypothetical protein n=1 Tax=Amycolatopsis sp. WQ 127309 TaxID=2932773 RepID=UPI001FF25AE7|nr:hypothetical protein [Amycolatopsis sp. WQ 127309]UOZ02748.1 hypothetical protein MUY22_28200 [Amycolatopsis sp. WQ 127309]
MTDEWFSLHLRDENHLSGPNPTAWATWSAELETIREPHAEPGAAHWFFDPLDDGFALWVHTGAWHRHEIVRRFQHAAARRGWRLAQRAGDPPTGQFADPLGRRRAEELATVSSELALDLCLAGEPTEGSGLPTAVLHLWSLLGAVSDAARASFLFSCWEHWTRGMRPGRRVALAGLAVQAADSALARAGDLRADGRFRDAWHRQLHLVERVARDEASTGATPVHYLMFEHAKSSAPRLGLPRDTLALAASLLRTALRDGTVSGRLAAPVPPGSGRSVPATR